MEGKKFAKYLLGFSAVYILLLFFATRNRVSILENGKMNHYVNAPFGNHILVEDWYFYGIVALIIIDVCSLMIFSLYNRISEKNE